LTVVSVLKRLEALEKLSKGGRELKVFIYYAERIPPIWKPEDPKTWCQSHPQGKAVFLTMRSCRSKGT